MRRRGIISLVLVAILAAVSLALYLWYRGGGLQQAVLKKTASALTSNPYERELIERALGWKGPQTYLMLFLNNTELRPGGGFIGVYAVVKIDRAAPSIVKIEGTERLDNLAPRDFPSVPPLPIQKYIGVPRWNFRDSNWSPDFASSSRLALNLYRQERGVEAEHLTGVIGFTPTVLEELLKLTGPITVAGQEFTGSNFTEKLEYEVEYGYANKGQSFDQRKQLLTPLTKAVLARVLHEAFLHWQDYYRLAGRLLAEKQIMIFATDPAVQEALVAKRWAGTMSATNGDYLLWADANLGALKTDAALERSLAYSFAPTGSGKFAATVAMRYQHRGSFNWRTTRYRTYARLYLPLGSTLIRSSGAMKGEKNHEPGTVDQGVENGRQWFGAFIAIEPGQSGILNFDFLLAPQVVEAIKRGSYHLAADKQLGSLANQLTLDLNFGAKVLSAGPGELPEKHGDASYNLLTDLKENREFEVKLAN